MGMVKMLQTFSTMLIAKFCNWLMFMGDSCCPICMVPPYSREKSTGR